jgi:hypothetical protein
MQTITRLSLVVLPLVFATAAAADEFPPRKPGAWEVKVVSEKHAPITLKMCIDKETDALFHKNGTELAEQACDHRDVKVDGDTATVEAQCKIGSSRVTSSSVTKFDGDTAFHADSKSHFDPPFLGRSDVVSQEDGKWVGPCPKDMEPGDFVMGNGMKVNIKMLSALKKFMPK